MRAKQMSLVRQANAASAASKYSRITLASYSTQVAHFNKKVVCCMEGKLNTKCGGAMAFIEFNNVIKTYQMGETKINAADGVNFAIDEGEFVIIVGPSGAGKTTVLNMLGGMEAATSGSLIVAGHDIARYNHQQLTQYRRDHIGFVFQFYNLVQNLTALENVELASVICKDPLDPIEMLNRVELSHRVNNFPSQLSGGEQQRVAIARAIAKNPTILLADEPTGALDYKTGKHILDLLQTTCRDLKKTVIVITHNPSFIPMADRVIHINSGRVTESYTNDFPLTADKIEW